MKRNTIIHLYAALMCALLLTTPAYADNEIPAFIPASTHDPSIRSPQVAAMIRHDNLPVNLNTGGINLEIPLVDWEDQDFECPISLSYNSAGFRPREQDNYVGRNWMLNVGGIVYRQVNGVPDDIDWSVVPISGDAGSPQYASGFLHMLGKHHFNREEMSRNYRTNPYKYAAYQTDLDCLSFIPGMKDVEATADVFHFSFGKHSGKFMINFDGSVSVSGNNGGKYKVDLSNMAIFDSTTPRSTRIRIMTDDGYIYTFGGEGYASLEYNALAWKDTFYSGEMTPPNRRNEISAYYLTEIQAPNGRKMTFTYKDDIDVDYHKHPEMLSTLYEKPASVRNKTALQYSLSGMSKFQGYRGATLYFEENPAFKPEPRTSYALTKVALLDRISIGNCTISFTYSNREKHINYTGQLSDQEKPPYICGAKLDEVELTCQSYTEKAQLTYTYTYGNRMFLQSVKNKEGRYTFQYKVDAGSTPVTPLTYNIDHWGFWRGTSNNSGIIPRMKPGTLFDQDYIILSNDRDATGECYDHTLLQEVTYPTGGYTRFEYEPHWYSSVPRPTFNTNYYIGRDYPVGVKEALAGGARMKSVTHYEQDKAVKKTIYTYGYTTYMGELTYMPYYRYLAHHVIKGESTIGYVSLDSEGITDIPHPSVHIRYPEVTEHYVNPTAKDLSAKHPYKVTEFVHYLADTNNYQGDFSYPTAPNVDFLKPDIYFKYEDIKLYNRNLLAHPTIDVSLKYGKVQKESFYNDENKLVARTEYEYKYLNKDKCALRIYTPGPHFGLRTVIYSHIINEPFYEYALVKKTTSRYTPDNNWEVRQIPEWYAYDENGYLSRHSVLESDGDSLVDSYTRIHRACGYGIQVLPAAHSLRMIGVDKDLLLQQDTVSYTTCQSAYLPSYEWYVPHNITSHDGSGRTQSVREYLHRDHYGNPIEIMTNHSERVIYLWAYYGKHPVAQIKNATYGEVTQALGIPLENLSSQYSPVFAIQGLQARLPKAQVHTYTYHPYAGISSETTPDGLTTYYDYDPKGRLVKTYRTGETGKQEILQLNNYHIINE